jgi:hypothetical protein
MMRIENCHFPVEEVSWPENRAEGGKDDRIRRLVPDHQNWRFFYPWEPLPGKLSVCKLCKARDACKSLCPQAKRIKDTAMMRDADSRGKGYLAAKPIKRKNEDGRLYNLVNYLISNEYLFFPATTAKDMLDAMSRIYDLDMSPPKKYRDQDVLPEYVGDY